MGSIAVVLVGYTLVIDAVGWIEVLKMSARYWSAFIFSYPRCWYVVAGVGGFIILIKSLAALVAALVVEIQGTLVCCDFFYPICIDLSTRGCDM